MKIEITKLTGQCPAPRVGTVLEVINTDEQLPEFINEKGKLRYHVMYHGTHIVICEDECKVVSWTDI